MAKRDNSRQSEEVELTPEQQAALVALLAGSTDEEAAQAAGVVRQTVNRWKSESGFRAALNTGQQEAWQASIDRLRASLSVAVGVVLGALESPDEKVRLAAAWRLLSTVPLESVKPTGATTARGVESEKALLSLYRFGD